MGFSGYYVVGRSGRPLAEQGALAGVRANLALYQRRADGWQIWQHPKEPDIGDMGALARSMGSPVLFGFVMDSDCVVVEAAAPDSGSWYACLAREAMAGYLDASGMVLDDLFLTAEDAVRRAAEWAAEAGTTMAAGPLKGVLCAKRPEPFAEELFFRFLDGLGIPGLSE
ncbi:MULTISPECIES: hypothetical protein [unclassified Streptomyces]|uniref:hypothetical protein n=1 Tax=unclassified Streptomyces TaxID=2593676 RepID=UPI002DDABE7A|nr:hypothetical protein [Streptomyces sp. NBC_01750]WSB00742.1 hypothetical protein OIE54_16390 [Streptomyces sp. NBC_01794]WSD34901.1 hypothetical protein OG966_25220 [Streptomyces sp. NBC_01750]